MQALEAAKIAYGVVRSPASVDVKLDHFVAFARGSILYARRYTTAGWRAFDADIRVLEPGITQTEAEVIERWSFEVSIRSALHRIVFERRQLTGALVERYRQPSGRIV